MAGRAGFWLVFLWSVQIAGPASAGRTFTSICDVNSYFYTDHESRLTMSSDLFYRNNFQRIPLQFGSWKAAQLDQKTDPYVSTWLYTDNSTGAEVYFMMVHGAIESDFHIPEVCYIDDGWSLDERKFKMIAHGADAMQVKYVRATYGAEVHHIYYFFLWKNAARQTASDGAYMFRVSVRGATAGSQTPDAIFANFLTALSGTQFGETESATAIYPTRLVRERFKSAAVGSVRRIESMSQLESFLLGQMVPNPTVPSPASVRRGLILSYNQSPGAPGYRYTFSRSSIYDDAVAVVALTMLDRSREASLIINGMMRSARPNGDLWFELNTHNTWPDEKDSDGAIIRTGASSWAGYAVCYHILAALSKNPNALNDDAILADYLHFARRIAAGVMWRQIRNPADPRNGLVTGGAGSYTLDTVNGELQETYRLGEVAWCSTEHNIDAFFFLRDLAYITGDDTFSIAADMIRQGLLGNLNPSSGQFNRGLSATGPDTVMALDCASWGAMFLEAIGKRGPASSALASAVRYENRSAGISGYRPYFDLPVYEDTAAQSRFFSRTPDLTWRDYSMVWSEGSLGVALASARLGKERAAEEILNNMLDPKMNIGGGIRYADKELQYQFSSSPSAIGTAWAILTGKKLEGGFLPDLFWSP